MTGKQPGRRAPGRTASAGMEWVPGGSFLMGSADFYPEERPVSRVEVDGSWMDDHAVAVAEFRRFVTATGYLTVAERPLDPAQYPGADPALLRPGSLVFHPTDALPPGLTLHPPGRDRLTTMNAEPRTFPGPIRRFLAQLGELRSGGAPNMNAVGRALAELAADEEYFAPLIAQIPADSPGVLRVVVASEDIVPLPKVWGLTPLCTSQEVRSRSQP